MTQIFQEKQEQSVAVKKPSLWTVAFFNDDFTPMDFVVNVLTGIFGLDAQSAEQIMLTIHTDGSTTVGKFTYDIAEMKHFETSTLARASGHPLKTELIELPQ